MSIYKVITPTVVFMVDSLKKAKYYKRVFGYKYKEEKKYFN